MSAVISSRTPEGEPARCPICGARERDRALPLAGRRPLPFLRPPALARRRPPAAGIAPDAPGPRRVPAPERAPTADVRRGGDPRPPGPPGRSGPTRRPEPPAHASPESSGRLRPLARRLIGPGAPLWSARLRPRLGPESRGRDARPIRRIAGCVEPGPRSRCSWSYVGLIAVGLAALRVSSRLWANVCFSLALDVAGGRGRRPDLSRGPTPGLLGRVRPLRLALPARGLRPLAVQRLARPPGHHTRCSPSWRITAAGRRPRRRPGPASRPGAARPRPAAIRRADSLDALDGLDRSNPFSSDSFNRIGHSFFCLGIAIGGRRRSAGSCSATPATSRAHRHEDADQPARGGRRGDGPGARRAPPGPPAAAGPDRDRPGRRRGRSATARSP